MLEGSKLLHPVCNDRFSLAISRTGSAATKPAGRLRAVSCCSRSRPWAMAFDVPLWETFVPRDVVGVVLCCAQTHDRTVVGCGAGVVLGAGVLFPPLHVCDRETQHPASASGVAAVRVVSRDVESTASRISTQLIFMHSPSLKLTVVSAWNPLKRLHSQV